MAKTQISVRLSEKTYTMLTALGPGYLSAIDPILHQHLQYRTFAERVLNELKKEWKSNQGDAISVDSIPSLKGLQFTSPGGLYRVLTILADEGFIAWSPIIIPTASEGAKQIADIVSFRPDRMLVVNGVKPGPKLWKGED